MSRAFVKEDGNDVPRRFGLPEPHEPGYDAASAMAMLEAANDGETQLAEQATGYRWGEKLLRPHIRRILDDELARPESEQNARLITLARRFLRAPAPL